MSGEANFNMGLTGLTVAGFTQPTVARTLLEMTPAIEKGLVQRFLWIIPKPSFAPFSSLESANRFFRLFGLVCFQMFNLIFPKQ